MVYDAQQRFRHGHGNTRKEVYNVRVGKSGAGVGRIPDMVIFPERVEQVKKLVDAAARSGTCLIPYGGGTNASQALKCSEAEPWMIISVDMSRMNRIRWVDRENRVACIEAGATGYHIEMSLGRIGLCLGHQAEDMEFSTLGGWIATRASGGKQNRYGDIEDITLDVEAVTPMGILSFAPHIDPRHSAGLDPKSFMFGSEGELCLITAAIVKVRPFPAKKCYDSFIFPTFDKGMKFINQVSKETLQPAGIRLVDNMQVQLSEALKPVPGRASRLKRKAKLRYLETIKGFQFDKIAACVMTFEGRIIDVRRQRRNIRQIAKKFNGFETGPENGRRGYEMTSAISYIRDCLMAYSVISDAIEATCAWDKASVLSERVKARVLREHHRRRLPGKPLIVCRISQVYQNGVSLYFSMTLFLAGVEDPVSVYTEFEEAAREEIFSCGGSLSPRNGLGKLRKGSTLSRFRILRQPSMRV
ncbi:FAD-binding domain-containing protein [Penicillium chermesinum]|nr:FAD-binding domain-containing protein [Penicillium chermesinum]